MQHKTNFKTLQNSRHSSITQNLFSIRDAQFTLTKKYYQLIQCISQLVAKKLELIYL